MSMLREDGSDVNRCLVAKINRVRANRTQLVKMDMGTSHEKPI